MFGPASHRDKDRSGDVAQSTESLTDYLEFTLIWRELSIVARASKAQARTFDHLDIIRDETHVILHFEARMAGLF